MSPSSSGMRRALAVDVGELLCGEVAGSLSGLEVAILLDVAVRRPEKEAVAWSACPFDQTR